jgi:bla regulator protein blaR1
MENGDARMLIQMAYPSATNELVGVPAWVRSDRFDVQAKSSLSAPTEEQKTQMMRAMMADRFKLAAHYEPKEIDSFALMLAREDGKLGPQIHPAAFDCAALAAAQAAGEQRLPPVNADGSPACGSRGSPGKLMFGSTTMAGFAAQISSAAGRHVVDKTGLTGRYDVIVEYMARPSRDAPAGAAALTPDERPDIATALREQLGLKLVPEKTTVQIVVVDRIEKPTEN